MVRTLLYIFSQLAPLKRFHKSCEHSRIINQITCKTDSTSRDKIAIIQLNAIYPINLIRILFIV